VIGVDDISCVSESGSFSLEVSPDLVIGVVDEVGVEAEAEAGETT
jgi:hypothetical protein